MREACVKLNDDQAAGLRRMARPVRVLAITSGKGGVGKTNVSVNLGVALAEAGREVLLMDADLGLANVDVLLGMHPKHNLLHVLNGERTLAEVLMEGPSGVWVVPASSGAKHMAELSPSEHAGLVHAFSSLAVPLDTLIVDTAAGISDSVVSFTRAAQEVLIVVCDEPASITDAYALIKLLSREHGVSRFQILANMVHSNQEARELYGKLLRVTGRFLDVTLEFMGLVPWDEYLRRAVQRQKPVVTAYPRARASLAFRNLAQKIVNWPQPQGASGRLEFFVERLVHAGRPLAETIS
jgi:flagellar biosynthesis protein FlhG